MPSAPLKPYRFAPPLRTAETAIDRPRLLDALDGRFERRLTCLRGGAGFGKTTLLCQAIASNLEDPIGIDVWLGCDAADDRASSLAAGLLTALGGDPSQESALEWLVDAVWKESPRSVALVLDDVHLLGEGGSGARLLEALLEALPQNGHLVLSSRNAPVFPIARLLASGEAVMIEEAELGFDAAERAVFLGERGGAGIQDLGGWPALMELAASAGADRVDDYVWEEVLARIDAPRLRLLARLAPLDWLDDDRVHAVGGGECSAQRLIEGLPLVGRGESGVFRLHALWHPVLSRVDPEWAPGERSRAIAALRKPGDAFEAIAFCKAFDAEDLIGDVIREVAGVARWTWFSTAELETLHAEFPEAQRSTPIGQFVEAIFRLHTDPPTAFPLLLAAREGFHQQSEAELEIAALVALGLLAYFAGSAALLRQAAAHFKEIDHPATPRFEAFNASSIAVLEGRPEDALDLLDQIGETNVELSALDATTAGIAALDAGRPERALREYRNSVLQPNAFVRFAMLTTETEARWLLGELGESEIRAFDSSVDDLNLPGSMHNTTVFRAGLAFQNVALGRIDVARRFLARLRKISGESLGPRARMAIGSAEMIFAVAEGRWETARDRFEAALEDQAPNIKIHRHSLRALPLYWLIAPAKREEIETITFGPCYAEGMRAAAALADLREGRGEAAAAALDWRRVDRFQIYFVPDLMLELAVAALAGGNSDAEQAAGALAERHRAHLRALAGEGDAQIPLTPASVETLGPTAKQLLKRIPALPDEPLEIRTLGPLELRRNGTRVEDPLLARGKVRALLQYLVVHPDVQRAQIANALWPDRDDSTAANNLRVNLSHLVRLLEPDRSTKEPSFFVTAEQERICLRVGEGLEIDRKQFDEELGAADAFDQEGRPGQALEQLEAALARYRGDYLMDAPDPDWGEIDRAHLRSRFVRAANRAASLRLGKGDFEIALDHLERATEVDPLHEASYRLQALVYFRASNPSAAREVLRIGAARLRNAGMKPSQEFIRLSRRTGAD